MKKQKRLNLSLVLILITAIILPACTNAPLALDKETISFAVAPSDLAFYLPLVKEFNRVRSNSKVILLPFEDGLNILDTAELASFADTFLLPEALTLSSAPGSYFLDLQPVIETDPVFNSDAFWEGALSACLDEEGHVLGIPLTLKIQGLYYDPLIFETLGLPTPQPGWTWDEFRSILTALENAETQTAKTGLMDGMTLSSSILSPLVYAGLAENENLINPEKLSADVQWYIESSLSGGIIPFGGEYMDYYSEFTENRPVMWVSAFGENPFGQLNQVPPEVKFVPFPVSEAATVSHTTPFEAVCAAVSSGTSHSRTAYDWLRFLSTEIGKTAYSGAENGIPARIPLDGGQVGGNVLSAETSDALRYALQHLNIYYQHPAVDIFIQPALRKAIIQKKDVVTLLTEAQSQLSMQPAGGRFAVEINAPPPPEGMEELTLIKFSALSTGIDELTNQKLFREMYHDLHPNIVILPVTISEPDSGQNFFAYLAQEADCFSAYKNEPLGEHNTAQLLDLDPLFENEALSFRQDYLTPQLDLYRYNNQMFGLPESSIPRVFTYNVDLLNSLGFEAPQPDWTFEQFIDLINLVNQDQSGQAFGYAYAGGIDVLMNGRGVKPYDLTVTPPLVQLNTPEMVNTLNWLRDLAATRAIDYGVSFLDRNTRIQNGQILFWETLAGNTNPLNMEQPFQTMDIPLPSKEGMNGGLGYTLQRGYFISRNNANPQACWDWIKFLSAQPNATGGVPARLSVAESPEWEIQIGEQYAQIYRMAARQNNLTIEAEKIPASPIHTWLGEAIGAVIQGGEAEPLLAAAQNKAQRYLTCMDEQDLNALSESEVQFLADSCFQTVNDSKD